MRKKWESRYSDEEFRFFKSRGWATDHLDDDEIHSRDVMDYFDRNLDGFIGLMPTQHSLMVLGLDIDGARKVRAFLKQNRLNVLNSGWHKDGFVLNFRTAAHAAKFRLCYTGDTAVA